MVKRTPLNLQRRIAVLETLEELGATSVIDLGCGKGELVGALLSRPRFARVAGMDVSSMALTIAARKLKPADLEQSARDIAELVTPILERPLSEISYGEVLIDIIRIGTRYEVRLPRELVLVAKQLLYFERYAKLMAPDWTILDDPDLIAFLFETAMPPPSEELAG